MAPVAFKQCCRCCEIDFVVCARCWRDQRYCSAACRRTGYRERWRGARRRYAASAPGRESHRRRQRRYRLRKCTDLKETETGHSSESTAPSIEPCYAAALADEVPSKVSQAVRLILCIGCGCVRWRRLRGRAGISSGNPAATSESASARTSSTC